MVHVLIRHAVEDYDRWKPYYDDNARARQESGSLGYRLFKSAADPNELVMLFEWDSMENAQSFFDSSDLREVMTEAGVRGEPEFQFLEELEAKTPERPAA